MQALIENIAKKLVDSPDDVSVGEHKDAVGITLELKVAGGDIGKVIGRQGRTARALRTILGAAASKQNRRYQLEILE
jgi:predicted RNA-binding protein YlqC (UPF0109 family)